MLFWFTNLCGKDAVQAVRHARLFVVLKYLTLPVLVTPSPTVRPDVSSYTCGARLIAMTRV